MSHVERAREIVRTLHGLYPEATCSLTYGSPVQLLVATILSAQCTDERVNKVTPALFERYSTALDFAEADLADVEEAIRSTGFFRSKARHIQGACRLIVERHGGDVPRTMEELTALPGVARKTANVVLGNAYGQSEGVVVDTHVGRVSRRLGLTAADDPVRVELDLIGLLPADEWLDFSHRVIAHGRALCMARRPLCGICPLFALCPAAKAGDGHEDADVF